MKTTPALTNLKIDAPFGANVAISCECNNARYHLWINRATLQPADECLYKNPLVGADLTFNTRTLDQARGIGKTIVPRMLEAAPQLLAEFERQQQEKKQALRHAQAEAQRAEQIRDAAPDLLEALEALLLAVRSNTSEGKPKTQSMIFEEAGYKAMAAIATARAIDHKPVTATIERGPAKVELTNCPPAVVPEINRAMDEAADYAPCGGDAYLDYVAGALARFIPAEISYPYRGGSHVSVCQIDQPRYAMITSQYQGA